MKYTKPAMEKEMFTIAEDIMADSLSTDGADSAVVSDGANVTTTAANSDLVIG